LSFEVNPALSKGLDYLTSGDPFLLNFFYDFINYAIQGKQQKLTTPPHPGGVPKNIWDIHMFKDSVHKLKLEL